MSTGLPNTYHISEEEKKFYDDNGYFVIKGFLDFATLYNHKRRFIQICQGVIDKGNISVVKEPSLKGKGVKGEDLINKVQDIHYDDVFMAYTEHPRLIHVLSQFIGEDMRVMNSMFINKPPGSERHPPHQDIFYFPFRPAEKIIATWTAVDDVTIENGCLFVIPKSHKRNILYPHGDSPDWNKLFLGILDPAVSNEPRIHLEMSPGDTAFFHPLLVHGSGANNTKNYRKAMTAHYASESCYYIDVRGTIQERVANEIEAEAKKRGLPLTFVETWKYKSKSVNKVQSKL